MSIYFQCIWNKMNFYSQTNLKKLMDLVEQNNAGQVNQFLEKGLDPNFQDPKTGGELSMSFILNSWVGKLDLAFDGLHFKFR